MDLTSKDYYELDYDLIPDNIYQQIVGETQEIEYGDEEVKETDTISSAYIQLYDGRQPYGRLPLVSNPYLQDYYAETWKQTVTFTTDSAPYEEKSRTEKVAVRVPISIYSETPIRYDPDDPATVSDVSGKEYIRTQVNQSGVEGIWGESFWGGTTGGTNWDTRLCGFENFNMAGGGTTSVEDLDTAEVEKVVVDSTYDGSRVDVTGKYLLLMDVYVYVINNNMHNKASWRGNTSELYVRNVSAFKLNIPYYLATTKTIAFEYHLNVAGYQNYPLKVTGNDLTTRDTLYAPEGQEPEHWDEFISNALMNKYANGKLWINAKVKASFLIENDLSINSIINIKKLNGSYITRFGNICQFQLKNIEYVYSGEQFIANIILLEV